MANEKKTTYVNKTDLDKKVEKPSEPVRQMKGEVEIYHDLFRLELATFKKNVGLPNSPRWENTPHVHYFHTYDSAGKKMTEASQVGGHTHVIETWTDDDGRLRAKCGPAIRKYKNNKQEVMPNDNHTHEITYMYSEKIKARRINQMARKHLDLYKNVPLTTDN